MKSLENNSKTPKMFKLIILLLISLSVSIGFSSILSNDMKKPYFSDDFDDDSSDDSSPEDEFSVNPLQDSDVNLCIARIIREKRQIPVQVRMPVPQSPPSHPTTHSPTTKEPEGELRFPAKISLH